MSGSLKILVWTVFFTLLFGIFAPLALAAPALSIIFGR